MKIKMAVHTFLVSFAWLLCTLTLKGQTFSIKFDLSDLYEKNQLEPFNREISSFHESDKRGIRFSKNQNDGIAWLKGIEFSNGTIDLDIRGKNVYQQSFVGIAFHGIDNDTLDVVYFRPFNFQSPDPVRKLHAVQYVSHPEFTWAVLRGKHNGRYENQVPPGNDGNEWFHARIEIQYPKVTIYVNGNNEPSLSIDKLNSRRTGKIGLWVGNNSDGDFANLKISTSRRIK